MTVSRKPRWTEEDEIRLAELYQKETEDIEEISRIMQRETRSIIGKLVSMKLYNPKPKEKRKTMKTMLRELESILDIQLTEYNLNKKETIEAILESIKCKLGDE